MGMRLFWILTGVFLALGVLFVGGAIVIFGDLSEIEKMVARAILDEPPKNGKQAADSRTGKDKPETGRRRKKAKKERPPDRPGHVDGRRAFDPSQLVVVNPPKGFGARAGQLGFTVT